MRHLFFVDKILPVRCIEARNEMRKASGKNDLNQALGQKEARHKQIKIGSLIKKCRTVCAARLFNICKALVLNKRRE